MPQWAGSCWYYLRFMDPHNDAGRRSQRAAADYWLPVDLYVGGAEHAVLHLLYARFWHKVLFDLGHVGTKEPFRAWSTRAWSSARRTCRRTAGARRRQGPAGVPPAGGRARPATRSGGSRAPASRRRAVGQDVEEPRQRRQPRRRGPPVRRRHDAPVRDVHGPARAQRPVADRGRGRLPPLPAAGLPPGLRDLRRRGHGRPPARAAARGGQRPPAPAAAPHDRTRSASASIASRSTRRSAR
jgi:hypothetical protein